MARKRQPKTPEMDIRENDRLRAHLTAAQQRLWKATREKEAADAACREATEAISRRVAAAVVAGDTEWIPWMRHQFACDPLHGVLTREMLLRMFDGDNDPTAIVESCKLALANWPEFK